MTSTNRTKGELGFRLIRVSPIDCFVAAYRAARLFRMSNRSRQLRSYLLSWGALGCFRLAPGWGRLVRTWAFPALEPLDMDGARTSVVRANALLKNTFL